MSNKLTDMQLVLLSAASQRDDHCLTLPTGVQRGSARKAAAKLLEAGLVKEVRARKDAPMWRRDEETEQPFALKLTAAGLMAIATEANEDSVEAAPTVDDAVSSQRPEIVPGRRNRRCPFTASRSPRREQDQRRHRGTGEGLGRDDRRDRRCDRMAPAHRPRCAHRTTQAGICDRVRSL